MNARIGFQVRLRDLLAALALVWKTDPFLSGSLAGLTLVAGLSPVASLYVYKILLDAVAKALQGAHPGAAMAGMTYWVIVQAGLGMVSSIVAFGLAGLTDLLSVAMQQHIQTLVLSKASSLEIASLELPETNNALKNALKEAGTRPLGMLTQILSLAQAGVTLLSIGALIVKLGGPILILLVGAALPLAIVTFVFNRLTLKLELQFTESSRLQSYLALVLSSDTLAKEIRLFRFARHLISRLKEHQNRFREEQTILLRRRTATQGFTAVSSAALIGAAIFLVVRHIGNGGAMTVGDFAFLIGGIGQAQSQFTSLFTVFTKAHENLLYLRNLFGFLCLPDAEAHSHRPHPGEIRRIEFERVSFYYPQSDRPVLQEVSFTLERGQIMALIGENGAGKSTLLKLLSGLYTPTSGRILINGVNITDLATEGLQQEVSAIFQDFGQYHLTVAENVHAGIEASRARLRAAIERSGAADFVSGMPRGLHNQLGRAFSGGIQLSGGQWQRLALARLFYKPASLWILDEPTSALDAAAEQELLSEIQRQSGDRVTVFVSHRMNMARTADKILIIEDGRIREEGVHDALIRQRGRYAQLYALQAQSFALAPS